MAAAADPDAWSAFAGRFLDVDEAGYRSAVGRTTDERNRAAGTTAGTTAGMRTGAGTRESAITAEPRRDLVRPQPGHSR